MYSVMFEETFDSSALMQEYLHAGNNRSSMFSRALDRLVNWLNLKAVVSYSMKQLENLLDVHPNHSELEKLKQLGCDFDSEMLAAYWDLVEQGQADEESAEHASPLLNKMREDKRKFGNELGQMYEQPSFLAKLRRVLADFLFPRSDPCNMYKDLGPFVRALPSLEMAQVFPNELMEMAADMGQFEADFRLAVVFDDQEEFFDEDDVESGYGTDTSPEDREVE
jgi:hypothetical protein